VREAVRLRHYSRRTEEAYEVRYYREVVDRGARGAAEPTDQTYGIREFGLCDINGVEIVFGQDINHP